MSNIHTRVHLYCCEQAVAFLHLLYFELSSWYFEAELKYCGNSDLPKTFEIELTVSCDKPLRTTEGVGVGGLMTFRILSLPRYVVDIGKSSPNPIFSKSMKTDKWEAYHSYNWTFLVILDHLSKIAKNQYKRLFFFIKT